MTKEEILQFVSEQKTAFIASVDENGYPVVRAMLAPRIVDESGIYFSTNTSSEKVKQYTANGKACVYFYKRGRFKYQGATVTGTVKIRTDQEAKDMIWHIGDTLFYKKGKTDPDYCVIEFTALEAEYYCDFKIEHISLTEE